MVTFDTSRCQTHKTTFVFYSYRRSSASFHLAIFAPSAHLSLSVTLPAPRSPPIPFTPASFSSLSVLARSSPFAGPMQVGPHGMLCCLICTAHSCSFIIVPLAAKALFFGQTMGGVVTESTVVMSHLPPRAISLSCTPTPPPSHPTRCPPFNGTLILLQERKTWELSIQPKPPRPQLYTYY